MSKTTKLPRGTRLWKENLRGDGWLVVERPPGPRSIILEDRSYFLSFPWLYFTVCYHRQFSLLGHLVPFLEKYVRGRQECYFSGLYIAASPVQVISPRDPLGLPPLDNISSSGNVCMGWGPSTGRIGSLGVVSEWAINRFWSSEFSNYGEPYASWERRTREDPRWATHDWLKGVRQLPLGSWWNDKLKNWTSLDQIVGGCKKGEFFEAVP